MIANRAQINTKVKTMSDIIQTRQSPRQIGNNGSEPVVVDIIDPETGEVKQVIRMKRKLFNAERKEKFLDEFIKWGRMGESAKAAGVATNTVRKGMEEDDEFAAAVAEAGQIYKDKLIGHHQDLVFNGTLKEHYDRNGNLVSSETIYPIRLIELELKKHDSGYREKQEIQHQQSGGVLIAPAEMGTIDNWEKKYGKVIEHEEDDDEKSPI